MTSRENVDLDREAEDGELDAAIAEADLGGGVPAEEVLRALRERREDHAPRG